MRPVVTPGGPLDSEQQVGSVGLIVDFDKPTFIHNYQVESQISALREYD